VAQTFVAVTVALMLKSRETKEKSPDVKVYTWLPQTTEPKSSVSVAGTET
jgi:hypothetical protein